MNTTTIKGKVIKGWYVAESDLLTSREEPRREIREGETLTLPDSVTPEVCEAGYHCARTLLDAFRYRTDGVITLVEVSGDVDVGDDKVAVGDDKVAGRSRKTLRIIPREISERECRLFAADVAERLLLAEREAGREPDVRSWKAVEVARAYAVGKATDEELLAAARAAAQATAVWAAGAAAAAAAWAAAASAWAAAAGAASAAGAAGAASAAAGAASAAAGAASAAAGAGRVARGELSRELEGRLLKAVGYREI